MNVQEPLWLLAVMPLFLILWFVHRHRKYVTAAKGQFRRPHLLDLFLVKTRNLSFILTVFFISFALAAPLSMVDNPPDFYTETRTIYLLEDTSTSMGRGPESSMEKVKVLSEQFAKRRHDLGDYIGIAAYSGHMGSVRGGAAVIVRPTRDFDSIKDAIAILQSQLLGAYTATGEGIWVCIQSIIREDVIRNNLDFEQIRQSVESIGTDKENTTYLLQLANKAGPQNDKVIVVFTDGTPNTGIDPAKPLWLAKRLGLKVYFIAFAVSGPTGLTQEEAEKRKQLLIRGVVMTGGRYFESSNLGQVASFFNEIDKMEKGKLLIKPNTKLVEDYEKYVWWAVFMLLVFILSEWRLKI